MGRREDDLRAEFPGVYITPGLGWCGPGWQYVQAGAVALATAWTCTEDDHGSVSTLREIFKANEDAPFDAEEVRQFAACPKGGVVTLVGHAGSLITFRRVD